jgi:hypothetical protein
MILFWRPLALGILPGVAYSVTESRGRGKGRAARIGCLKP